MNGTNGTNGAAAALEGGSYDVIRKRLLEQAAELATRAESLNEKRKQVFGGAELALIANERVRTENNCITRDVISIGGHLLFGFQVFLGLKAETNVNEVFALYRFERNGDAWDLSPVPFEGPGAFLADEAFIRELRDVFRYGKDVRLLRLKRTDTRLLAVVQTGATVNDVKVLRWAIDAAGRVTYMDARGDEDARPPKQHGFGWIQTGREDQVAGAHPHVSILDTVFVETVRRRPHDQGREQHEGRSRDLPRAGRRREPDPRRRRHRLREDRAADPPPDQAVPRGPLPLLRVRHAGEARRAHRRDRAELSRAARRSRHRLPRRLLPPERRPQGLRRRHHGARVRARREVAQRRGRALRLPRAERGRVPAAPVQHDPEGGRDADPVPRLHAVRRWHARDRPRRGRAHARAPDPDLAHALRLGRERRRQAARRELPREGRQRRSRARHLRRVRAPAPRRDREAHAHDVRGPHRRRFARARRALLARQRRDGRPRRAARGDEEDERARPRRVRQGRGDREARRRGAREGDRGPEGAPPPRPRRRPEGRSRTTSARSPRCGAIAGSSSA